MPISRSSTHPDVILFLQEHDLQEVVSEFESRCSENSEAKQHAAGYRGVIQLYIEACFC